MVEPEIKDYEIYLELDDLRHEVWRKLKHWFSRVYPLV
ncbi:hypothetical protein Cflav_PD5235 [Pedosphaera parvula Ellin514]|uniref:Uncharacterized protein n=1 Tax=Pedosphaera parvula (strain Ellin514) TaxID=320771 RepID=B9XCD2_PEDPL|nr:hypothetical protein Cflav_PD5235 [Pedosphaera parvula Ellin514]